MKYVKEFKPKYIILENVSGMRSTAEGHFEKEIKRYMDKLGYTPTVALLNAADYGVPQVRQRLIFVGVKRNAKLTIPFVFPKGEFVNCHRTVFDAISDLPPLNNNEQKTGYNPKFKQRIRLTWDSPSPTQLAGGIRPQFQFGHPDQARGLTIRERARIQSFPDSYIFKGGIVQERVQTGNAVPPLLIYSIAKVIAEDRIRF